MRKGNYDAEFQHTATRRWLRTFRHWFIFNVRFQHTATRRWLQVKDDGIFVGKAFQHTATRRWLPGSKFDMWIEPKFQHTATRRWLRCFLARSSSIINERSVAALARRSLNCTWLISSASSLYFLDAALRVSLK